MTLAEITKDTEYWQRLLRLGGYNPGAIDGIEGKNTRAAAARWAQDAEEYKRRCGVYDERTEGVLETLIPAAQKKLREWMQLAQEQATRDGLVVKLIDGTRSYAEQNKLYAKKPKVTNAKGGYSWHNFGLAADFGVFANGKYLTDDADYKKLGRLVQYVDGLEWGGNWKSFVDTPHLQLKMFNSIAEARAKF